MSSKRKYTLTLSGPELAGLYEFASEGAADILTDPDRRREALGTGAQALAAERALGKLLDLAVKVQEDIATDLERKQERQRGRPN